MIHENENVQFRRSRLSGGLYVLKLQLRSQWALLARFAASAKVSVIQRLPAARRLATLVAFVQSLEATAQDDALEVLEILLRNLFAEAVRADRKARLRTLKDLDQAALTLAQICALLLDEAVPDHELRSRMLARTPPRCWSRRCVRSMR